MSYVESILKRDENIIYRAKLHSVIIVLPVVVVLLLTYLVLKGTPPDSTGHALAWLGIAAIWLACSVASYFISEVALTNRRLIGRIGFPVMAVYDIEFSEMAGIEAQQSLPGMIFGWGHIAVRKRTGEIIHIGVIPDPSELTGRASSWVSGIVSSHDRILKGTR